LKRDDPEGTFYTENSQFSLNVFVFLSKRDFRDAALYMYFRQIFDGWLRCSVI